MCRSAGAAHRHEGDERDRRELEGHQPRTEVARGRHAGATRGCGQQQGRGHRGVPRARTPVVEERECSGGREQDAGLQRAGHGARGPQAGTLRSGQAQRANGFVVRSHCRDQRGHDPDEEHREAGPDLPVAPLRQERVADEHEHHAEGGQQCRREHDGVDAHERGRAERGHHGEPTIWATAPAIRSSSGPGKMPSTMTDAASTPRIPSSVPLASGVTRCPSSSVVTDPDDARHPQRVGRGEGGTDRRGHGAGDEEPSGAVLGRQPGGVHGEELTPEAGQTGQAQARSQPQDEEEAQPGRGLAQRRPGHGEVDAPPALLQATDEEEQQRGDHTVGDVREERRLQPRLRPRGQREDDEAHVGDRGVGDEPLEVALDEADEPTPDDADDPEDREHRGEPPEAVGHARHGQPDQAVGTHLEQHRREQHRPGGGGRGVRRREPRVQGEDRHLDGEPTHEQGGDEQLAVGGQRLSGPGRQFREAGRAGGGHEREDADEHEGRAEGGVEHEAMTGVDARRLVVAVAVPADEHPHRHEDQLERDEEQHGIPGGEGRERAGLDEQEAAEEGGRAPSGRQVDPRVGDDEHTDHRGQQHQGYGDVVDPERPAHPELGQPGPVDPGAGHGHDECEERGGERGDHGGDPGDVDREVTPTGDEPQPDGGGHGEEQADHHASTPTTPSTTTAASTSPTAELGRSPWWARAPAWPAALVSTAVPRT